MNVLLRFFSYTLCCLLAAAVVSCGSDEPLPPSARAPRTVLTYIIATNNLGTSGYDSADLDEMRQAAAAGALDGGARWLVYHAASDGSAPRLMELTADGFTELAVYESGSSATASRMHQVMTDAERLAPADTYGLVLWSHATGWLQDGLDEQQWQPRSFGSDNGAKMNVTTLSAVLARHNFDYVYFDACYMGTVEVAYELRNAVKYIVGSPSELPVEGMPYHKNVAPLLNGSAESLKAAATNTFDYYSSKLLADERTCTMVVISTAALDDLAAATRAIYEVTPLPHPGDKVTNYRNSARQGYSIDFGEYVRALADTHSVDPAITGAYNSAMARTVIYCDATPYLWDRYPIHSTSGLATYVFNRPEDFDVRGYTDLQWAADVVSAHVNHNQEEQ